MLEIPSKNHLLPSVFCILSWMRSSLERCRGSFSWLFLLRSTVESSRIYKWWCSVDRKRHAPGVLCILYPIPLGVFLAFWLVTSFLIPTTSLSLPPSTFTLTSSISCVMSLWKIWGSGWVHAERDEKKWDVEWKFAHFAIQSVPTSSVSSYAHSYPSPGSSWLLINEEKNSTSKSISKHNRRVPNAIDPLDTLYGCWSIKPTHTLFVLGMVSVLCHLCVA